MLPSRPQPNINKQNQMNKLIELRPATPDDTSFMSRLFARVCEDELGLGNWDAPQKQALLAMQFEAQSRSYRENYPESGYQIVLFAGQPVGRIFIHRGRDAIRIVDIALVPEQRNRGIGGELVNRVLEEAAREQKPVRLSVRHSNPAQRLYHRLGFTLIGHSALHDDWEWSGSGHS
jgi:ribosomal protein S18 acetylase RimI-like enzyme